MGGGGGVKVEIKAISAQPTEVGLGLSWAELGNILGREETELLDLRLSKLAGSKDLH